MSATVTVSPFVVAVVAAVAAIAADLFLRADRCGEVETAGEDAAPVLCLLLLGVADDDDSCELRRGDVRFGLPDIWLKWVGVVRVVADRVGQDTSTEKARQDLKLSGFTISGYD